MKNVKLSILALTTVLGITCAFANTPQHFSGTTYYGVTDGVGGFTWTTVDPSLSGRACVETTFPWNCIIITIGSYVPQPNVVPTSSQAVKISFGIYR